MMAEQKREELVPGCTASNRMTCAGTMRQHAVDIGGGATEVRTYRTGAEHYMGNMLTNSPSNLEDPRWLTTMQNPICSSVPWRHREPRKFQGWK
jgi:hypothetical protein